MVHIALAWFIVGSIIGLLLETTIGTWWWVAYHGLAGGNALGLIVYVNGGAYLLAEEWHMIISHLNNLKDREEAEAKAQRELRAAREQAEEQGRRAGQAQAQREVAAAREQAEEQGRQAGQESARQETISAVAAAKQQLTPEELDNLPPAMRELLNRYSGDNSNGSDNGAASR